MDAIEKRLLKEIADLHEIPTGAYNIRANSESAGRNTTANIDIVNKTDKSGIDIIIKPGTKNESVHIPVIISRTGLEEVVYNDFYVGEDADVTIIAGCGIHNTGCDNSKHDGIHTFHLAKGAKVKYVEKHYADGEGSGKKIMNPETVLNMDEDSYMYMDTVQIKGIDNSIRKTNASLAAGATLVIKEKIMTHEDQFTQTEFNVDLNGEGATTTVTSRSVAKDVSKQVFYSTINGNALCSGHTECDAIIMDKASVSAIPKITANNPDASLIHEAAIGKIAGEQLVKLMSLGLTEKEAEEHIIQGFLK